MMFNCIINDRRAGYVQILIPNSGSVSPDKWKLCASKTKKHSTTKAHVLRQVGFQLGLQEGSGCSTKCFLVASEEDMQSLIGFV